MPVKPTRPKIPIVIIGAGAAGFSAALELANEGYFVELIEKETFSSGSSSRNPGRMGHGFHYTDIETAKAYLRASILVQRTYPGYLVGQDLPFESNLRHGRYYITKNSDEPQEKIIDTYKAIHEEYERLVNLDPANKVFGNPDTFLRKLEPFEYEDIVGKNIVDVGFETSEHLFNWKAFSSDMKRIIEQHPKITLREHTEVTNIYRNDIGKPRFTVETKATNNQINKFETDYIVNSTWQDIKRINENAGLRMIPNETTNRLKTLLVLKLPESLEHMNSAFFCMGQHCMIANLGQRKAMATFAQVTNLEVSSKLTLSKKAQRLLNGGATQEEKDRFGKQMITGISKYVPEMIHAKILDVQFGIVQTPGSLTLKDLKDPSHPFHKRNDHCIRTEQIGFISNPCMKLFYFVENGKIVADMIKEHEVATNVIRETIFLVETIAAGQKIKFDKIIRRAVLENMERYEASTITYENMMQLAESVLTNLKAKTTLLSSLSFLRAPAKTEFDKFHSDTYVQMR